VKDYLTALHEAVDLLFKANDRLYGAWHKRLVEANRPWTPAITLNRQGEYLAKLKTHFGKIASNETEYQSAKVLQDMLGWPPGQADAFKTRAVAAERTYEIAVAKAAVGLVGVKRGSHVPDFAGEFLLRTAGTLLEAIWRNDLPTFGALFPLFFDASVNKVAALLHNGEAFANAAEQIQRLNVAMGPLLDLMELSGYAILSSELHQSSEPWGSGKTRWDRYLLEKDAGPKRMQLISGILQLADVPMTAAPGELIRTGWRTQIHQLLRNVPVQEDFLGSASGIYRRQQVQHASALVRILARNTFSSFYRGIDIFVAMYFAQQLAGVLENLDLRASGLIDALRRESQRGHS